MGASASKQQQAPPSASPGDTTKDGQPLQLNRTLLNKIESATSSSPSSSSSSGQSELLTPARQSHLDSNIQSKIQAELKRLRSQEDAVRKEIELALEKENLEQTKGSAKKAGRAGKGSNELREELQAVKERIERHQRGKETVEKTKGVKEAREKVEKCYRENPSKTLDCWAEVQAFKQIVARAEKDFISTLS